MRVKKQFEKRIPSRHALTGSAPVFVTPGIERLSPAYIRRSRALDMKIDRALKEAKLRLEELQRAPRK